MCIRDSACAAPAAVLPCERRWPAGASTRRRPDCRLIRRPARGQACRLAAWSPRGTRPHPHGRPGGL
eukprot:7466292-Alexandrium_andersonii.AAC.1